MSPRVFQAKTMRRQKHSNHLKFLAILRHFLIYRLWGQGIEISRTTALHYEFCPHSFSIRAINSGQLSLSDIVPVKK